MTISLLAILIRPFIKAGVELYRPHGEGKTAEALLVDFSLGHPMGNPSDHRLQERILAEALKYLKVITEPGTFIDRTPLVHIIFREVDAKDVCRVIVEPLRQSVYVNADDETTHYFLRTGNATRGLDVQEALQHAAHRWQRAMTKGTTTTGSLPIALKVN